MGERVEDTDQSREVEGALEQFQRAFDYFGIQPTEGEGFDDYGPYSQSARETIYLTYVRQLLRAGKAYLCFASKDELDAITKRQQAAKLPPGYYGGWAIWRDADPANVEAELEKGTPYVVRFRAPDEAAGQLVRYTDDIRGELEHEANRNDVVILKSSDQPLRLPTYHFAHAIDDHLMRTTVVIRGEEWISSVPLHLQLFDALGFPLPRYAHIAPLMKQIPGGKRKLSKRKDPEASVDFYIAAGYPAEAVLYYLRGLANGRRRTTAPRSTHRAHPPRRMRRRRPARRPGQARGHLRRLHRHPVRRASPRRAAPLGRHPRPRDPRRPRHQPRPRPARPDRGTGRRRQPPQRPA